MGMVVRTNTMAINAYRQLGLNNNAVSKSLEKLASGYRINRAGDDAAGLAISEKMKAQITGLETASANAQDGISLIQTAEGNLSEVHDMLNRMVELSTKSANGTYTVTERQALQDEVDQLLDEIDRISKSANFNGAKLLDGSLAAVNAISDSGVKLTAATPNATLYGDTLGVTATNNINHSNDNVKTRKDPAFAINLEDVKVSLPANASTTATASYAVGLGQINGKSVSIYTSSTGSKAFATEATLELTQAASAAAGEKDADTVGGLFNNKYAVIGTDVYKMTYATGKITFAYQGQKDGTQLVDKDADGGAPTAQSVVPQGNVTLTVATGGSAVAPTRIDCHVTDITDPQAGTDVQRAGAKLTLTADIINRGSLTIGDTTFTFDKTAATPADGTPTATTKAVTIGLKDFVGADGNLDSTKTADMLKSVTEQMSHCTVKIKTGDKADGTEYTFNVGRGSSTAMIEIEEAATATYGKFTQTQLQKAFSQTQTAANAKAEITFSKDKEGNLVNVSEGSTLTVDGTAYKFVTGDADSAKNEIKIGDTAKDTINNIKTALGSAYTVTADTTKGTITLTKNGSDKTAFGKTAYATDAIDAGGLTLQIGDTAEDFNKMTVTVKDMSANGLGLEGLKKTGIMTEKSASDAIDTIKTAINTVSSTRASMGALQNRLEHTINNLDVAAENLSSANSRIRDTDMAKEMMNYTKMNVLVQSAQAMLAQANQQPQSVLQLLQ